jgi:recombination protein RecA
VATEDDRRRTIQRKLACMPLRVFDLLPTGFAVLDQALGGGLPRGGIVEIFGPPASFKTTLSVAIIANLEGRGGGAAWIDAEHSFDPALPARWGLSLARLPVVQPESAEQAFSMAVSLAGSGAIDLLVIDSAAALVPSLELETGLGASGPGLQGRVLAAGLRKLTRGIAKTNCVVLFLNQIRSRGSDSGAAETSAGGPALKLHAATRISLEAGRAGTARFLVLKNKAGAAFAEGSLLFPSGAECVKRP